MMDRQDRQTDRWTDGQDDNHDTIHGNDKSVDKSHCIVQNVDTNEGSTPIPQAQILGWKFLSV